MIEAKIIADSIQKHNCRLTTFIDISDLFMCKHKHDIITNKKLR